MRSTVRIRIIPPIENEKKLLLRQQLLFFVCVRNGKRRKRADNSAERNSSSKYPPLQGRETVFPAAGQLKLCRPSPDPQSGAQQPRISALFKGGGPLPLGNGGGFLPPPLFSANSCTFFMHFPRKGCFPHSKTVFPLVPRAFRCYTPSGNTVFYSIGNEVLPCTLLT